VSLARAILIWKITGLALAAVYAIAGIAGMLADWETGETILWVVFLVGGGLLIVVGQRLFDASPTLAGILASVGAAAGGFALFWLIVVPLAAAVVIALSVAIARQTSAAT
jgi:FtsH-binding integral membrane protein